MTAILIPNGKQQYFSNAGLPLVGGKIETWAAGTSTPKDTYTTAAGNVANTNPVTLDGRGEATIFWNGSYKVQLRDALNNIIWTLDNVVALDVAAMIAASTASFSGGSGSSLIGFIQSGAGAVAETSQKKLREWVSPQDFGAIGNGVTNDNTAIAAVAAAYTGINFNGAGGNFLISADLPAGFKMLNGRITDSRTINAQDEYSVVAIGYNALLANTFIPEVFPSSGPNFAAGNYIVAIGGESLKANTTGRRNVGVGSRTLLGNTTGYYQTAIGSHSMENCTTGFENTGVGVQTLQSLTTGNGNSMLGVGAGIKITAGTYNIGVGQSCMSGIGVAACTSNYNVAVGYQALGQNTSGDDNIAIGRLAMQVATTATANVAIGTQALIGCITGQNNTAVGYQALFTATGSSNTAVGQKSLFNLTTGTSNVGIGQQAGANATTSSNNVIIGFQAGVAVTTGGTNTIIGAASSAALTTGAGNTALGYGTAFSAVGAANQTAIGNSATCTADNQVQLGNGSVSSFRCQVALTVVSDERDKIKLGPVPGLAFINGIETFQARWNKRDGSDNGNGLFASLSAQNLKTLQDNFKVDLGLVDATNPAQLSVTHERLFPLLINAVQELSAEVEALRKAA